MPGGRFQRGGGDLDLDGDLLQRMPVGFDAFQNADELRLHFLKFFERGYGAEELVAVIGIDLPHFEYRVEDAGGDGEHHGEHSKLDNDDERHCSL